MPLIINELYQKTNYSICLLIYNVENQGVCKYKRQMKNRRFFGRPGLNR